MSGSLRTIFSADDYPTEAIHQRWEGKVVADLSISAEGLPTACRIVQTSGHDILDSKTCEILLARARFIPAKDRQGHAVADVQRTPPILWQLPPPPVPGGPATTALFSYEDYPPEALKKRVQGTVRTKLWISKEGRVSACRIVQSSGNKVLDDATCNIISLRARFTPARDADGNPTEDTYLAPPVTWRIP